MHYAAIVGDEEHEVEIIEVSPGSYEIAMDGKKMSIDVRSVAPTSMSFLLDNHAYNIEFEKSRQGGENLLVRGHVISVEVVDLRTLRLRRVRPATGSNDGPATIASPMPGKVVAVLVKEGQQVAQGDGLVVVEAMKMENELKAPRAGTVKDLIATEGAPVDGGATLCVVE